MNMEAHTSNNSVTASPIIVDLGNKSRKRIKQLRRGKGKLVGDVQDCVEELRQSGRISGDAQPVVIVVKQKRRRGRWGASGLGF